MASGKYLIVNADNLGQSPGITRGALEAHDRGIVTSASLMVRPASAEAAAEECRRRPALSVGLHLDLGEWYLDRGKWESAYEVVPAGDEAAIEAECRRQLDRFRRLMGKDPTHLDSHQHAHRRSPARGVALALARELGVPLRHENRAVWFCGYFFGQYEDGRSRPEGVGVDWLLTLLQQLPAGYTELNCHPGYCDIRTWYCRERELEVATLCDPRVRQTLDRYDIELRHYGQVPAW